MSFLIHNSLFYLLSLVSLLLNVSCQEKCGMKYGLDPCKAPRNITPSQILHEPNEDVNIPAINILIPDAISKITSHPRPSNLSPWCCWKEFKVVWDLNNKPIIVSLEQFLCDPGAVVEKAHNYVKWVPAEIHPHKHESDPYEARLKGNGFPGSRGNINEIGPTIATCLDPVMRVLWPQWSFETITESQHEFGLVSSEEQPFGKWLDSQRIPHNDVKWNYGVRKSGEVPPCFATVYALTDEWKSTGTTIFRSKGTNRDPNEKISLLETLSDNENAQGAMNPHIAGRLHPELDVRVEVPDPYPQYKTDHAWAEGIVIAHVLFNRQILYDARRLHNQYMTPPDYERLSFDPKKGRLTLNSFFWQEAKKLDFLMEKKRKRTYRIGGKARKKRKSK